MDLGTSIIGVIIIITCVLPFVLICIKKRKQHKKVIDNLSNIAKMNKATIETNEIWNQSAIGFDATNKMLFFSKKASESGTFEALNLSEIIKSSVVKYQNNNQPINRLELKFEFNDKNKSDKSIEFYNQNETLSLVNELELIEKWNSIITKSI
ncbi:hypothetical protein [Flavobacterium sp.]|uniref:hypothetical protein n=1 Tax=Flavobacterium sp. TaxID=239 RepID=UPI0037525B7C